MAVYGVEREAANAKMLLIKIIINIGVGKEGEKNMKKIKIYENYTWRLSPPQGVIIISSQTLVFT